MSTYSTTDHPTDQARAQLAARVSAFLDQLRREELSTIDHLRDVAARYAEPLDLSEVPDNHAGEILAQHNRRRAETLEALSGARDRLAAVNEAIEALP